MVRRAVRLVTFLVAFGASAVSCARLADRAIAASGAERGAIALDFAPDVERWRKETLDAPAQRRIAFVGDSMLWSSEGAMSLPDRIARIVNRSLPKRKRWRPHPLASGGFTMLGEYCLADDIIDTKPSLLVLEVNLRALQPGPLGPFSRAELAGRIRWPRIVEAAFAPLSDAGLTVDRLLFYRLLTKLGLERPWSAVIDRQARLVNASTTFETWLETKTHSNTMERRQFQGGIDILARAFVPGKSVVRPTRENSLSQLGALFGGLEAPNGRLRVLELLLDDFRREGIPVLVWVSPVNVDHFRSVGLSTDGLAQSVQKLRAMAKASGASFVDLHEAVPDGGFRDSLDHYTVRGEQDGTAIVARELAKAIGRAQKEAEEEGPVVDALQ
jgi:hypothetical protein